MSGLKAVMRVSPQLARVVGQSEMPRTEAVKKMYVRAFCLFVCLISRRGVCGVYIYLYISIGPPYRYDSIGPPWTEV